MAPIRRYLRITQFSVLEVRIYLDTPQLAESWLLNPRLSILPRVIESVRPLVLPKLREATVRAVSKGKGKGRKKTVRDVVVEDDFEVAVFMMETDTRHSILRKQKLFRDAKNKGRHVDMDALTGNSTGDAIDVDAPGLLREESDEMAGLSLSNIPSAAEPKTTVEVEDADGVETQDPNEPPSLRRSGRSKRPREPSDASESLSVSQSPESSPAFGTQRPSKRVRPRAVGDEDGDEDTTGDGEATDDKKKMGIKTTYDGYSIYGRILCLIVKRRGDGLALIAAGKKQVGGQASMENWIASTQAPADDGEA